MAEDYGHIRPGGGPAGDASGVWFEVARARRLRSADGAVRQTGLQVAPDPAREDGTTRSRLASTAGGATGLPVVPPTDVRILRMLDGTTRKPAEIIGDVPPNLSPITVEKVAVNAVMAGCRPEYMPVVIAALEAALDPLFTMHGLLVHHLLLRRRSLSSTARSPKRSA